MSNYLWDKTGIPDPEVERLEKLLVPFRYERRGPHLIPLRPRFRPAQLWPVLGAAAAILLVASAWWAVRSEAWSVSVVRREGLSRNVHLHAGETLETAAGETAHMSLERVGRLDVDPETTLRVISSRPDQQHLELMRGTIHAHIGAAPRVFVVNTPSATATDLGCAYTLHVEQSGDGMVQVNSGLVEFDWHGRRALVPTGAMAITKAGTGPGTPFFDDALPSFRRSLATFDFVSDTGSRAQALETVLATARPRDAVTLLNLIPTVAPSERAAVVARLAELLPPSPAVDLDDLRAGRFQSLQAWWNELGLRHHPAVQLF